MVLILFVAEVDQCPQKEAEGNQEWVKVYLQWKQT